MNRFVNFSNHPSEKWDRNQREEALKYGMIQDIPFPAVDPDGDEAYIDRLAELCTAQIEGFSPRAVLCQGEFCLAYQVTARLKEKGILVLAACSERVVKEDGHKKEVSFTFRRFRRY